MRSEEPPLASGIFVGAPEVAGLSAAGGSSRRSRIPPVDEDGAEGVCATAGGFELLLEIAGGSGISSSTTFPDGGTGR